MPNPARARYTGMTTPMKPNPAGVSAFLESAPKTALAELANRELWKPNSTLLLMDARHACYRAWHTRDLSDPTGNESTSAVYGLLGIAAGICDDARSTRIIFCWDSGIEHKRKFYPAYKSRHMRDRTPEEEAEAARREKAIRLAEDTTLALGLGHAKLPAGEADDLIAMLIERVRKDGTCGSDLSVDWSDLQRIVVVTDDNDAYQFADAAIGRAAPNVPIIVWRAGLGRIVTEESFVSVYGFHPSLYAHYKAFVGESASGDNIPGVPGIGDKRAGQLVAAYGKVENILAECKSRATDPKMPKYERAITAHEKELRISLKLSQLRGIKATEYSRRWKLAPAWHKKSVEQIDAALTKAYRKPWCQSPSDARGPGYDSTSSLVRHYSFNGSILGNTLRRLGIDNAAIRKILNPQHRNQT